MTTRSCWPTDVRRTCDAFGRATGIAWFVADVLAVNHLMLQVFADAGFRIERHRKGGDVTVRMSTDDTRAARAARAAGQELTTARNRKSGTPDQSEQTSGNAPKGRGAEE